MTSSLTPSKPSKSHGFSFLLLFLALAINPFILFAFEEALGRKKETHLHFYIHMIFGGPNATSTILVSPNDDITSYGTIRVFDHELRAGPERTSRLIGRLQGTATQASRVGIANLVEAHHVFTEGKYNGSTLAIFERYVPSINVSTVLPNAIGRALLVFERFVVDAGDNVTVANIIGGAGKFMLVRGYSIVRLHSVLNYSSEVQTGILDDHSYFKHCEIEY